jgi:hypothetical protein
MSACLDQNQLRNALEVIARSGTDSAEHLRHLAARALHCGSQPANIEEVDACLVSLHASEKVSATVKQMLKDNSDCPMPKIYLHGTDGKVGLLWQYQDDIEVLFVIGDGYFELLKLSGDRLVVRREHVVYTGGKLDQNVTKYLPKKYLTKIVS